MTPHRLLLTLGLVACTAAPMAAQTRMVSTGANLAAEGTVQTAGEQIEVLSVTWGTGSQPPPPPPSSPGKDHFPDCFICD